MVRDVHIARLCFFLNKKTEFYCNQTPFKITQKCVYLIVVWAGRCIVQIDYKRLFSSESDQTSIIINVSSVEKWSKVCTIKILYVGLGMASITKNFVYYTHSRTQLYFTQQYSKNTTTCFGPICWPSSGCDLTYGAAIQDVWGVLLGYWVLGGGNKISLFQ